MDKEKNSSIMVMDDFLLKKQLNYPFIFASWYIWQLVD